MLKNGECRRHLSFRVHLLPTSLFAYYSILAYFVSGGTTTAGIWPVGAMAAGGGVGAGCIVAATTVGSTESACEVSAWPCSASAPSCCCCCCDGALSAPLIPSIP